MSYYEPAEDSELLFSCARSLRTKENPRILEVGVGSGYVISELAKCKEGIYFGSDINPSALESTKKRFQEIGKSIQLSGKSFFDGFTSEQFDIVLFNAPYLPLEDEESYEDLSDEDKALYGGKEGYEIIEQFLIRLNDNLSEKGKCLLVFSSLSHLNYIKSLLDEYLFDFKVVAKEKHFFEELYCLEICKSETLRKLSRHISKIRPFAKGKHSRAYLGQYHTHEAIAKVAHEAFIAKEFYFLEKLSDKTFVPNLYAHDKDFVIMQKIEGTPIFEFLEHANSEEIKNVLNEVLKCCFTLDKRGITKFEMTNPYKHIIVKENNKVVFIDFERSIFSESPKNTRQFLESIRRHKDILDSKGLEIWDEKIRLIGKEYKQAPRLIKFDELLVQ